MAANGTQAVDRAALLISTVVQADEPLTFADLQEACDLPKSTTSRMLTALERSELLERNDDGSYVAGSLFWLYAARHDPGEDLVRLARPTLETIGEQTHETVNLSVGRGDRVVQVAQVDSRFILGSRDWTQVDVPAHCSSLGKVFLAWGVVRLPDGPLDRPTPATIANAAALRADHACTRSRGWADHRRRARDRALRHRGPRARLPRSGGRRTRRLGADAPTGRTVRRGRAAVERPCRGAHRAAARQDTRGGVA